MMIFAFSMFDNAYIRDVFGFGSICFVCWLNAQLIRDDVGEFPDVFTKRAAFLPYLFAVVVVWVNCEGYEEWVPALRLIFFGMVGNSPFP